MANGPLWVVKHSRVNGANATNGSLAGVDMSMWQYEGNPCHGAVPPTTYANPTNLTQGALGQADPAAGKQTWLASVCTSGVWNNGWVILHDRLLHISGFSGTVTGAQNVNSGSAATLSRTYTDLLDNNNIGNEIWLETYTAIGATATTVTASYHNTAGTLQTTQAVAFGGAATAAPGKLAQSCVRLPLAAGDIGVQDIVSVSLAGSTGTAGNFGVFITHPLLRFITSQANAEVWSGAVEGMINIMPGACLFWTYNLQGAATANNIAMPMTCLNFAEK